MSRKRRFVYYLVLLALPCIVQAQPVTQPFTFSNLPHDLPMLRHGSISWGDLDGDLDLDVFLNGESGTGIVSSLYVNQGLSTDGSAHFTALSASITPVVYSFSSWADFDGDGDLDLLVAGSTTLSYPYTPTTSLYRNDGGAFSPVSVGLPGLHSGSSSWGDLDGDGDMDLVLTGVNDSDNSLTVVAINNGGGQFDIKTDVLPGKGYGDSALGDVDKDGDLDVILSGAGTDGFSTRLFLNNAGQFSASPLEFGNMAFSSVDLGDYDNDSDLDLIVGGGAISASLMDGQIRLWQNTGGTFSPVSHTLEGVLAGDVTWGDYDNDGDLDLLVLGAAKILGKRNARIYRNDGGNSFVNASILIGSIFSDVEWGDYDADGDLDLLTSGFTPYAQSTTNLYLNQRQVRPTIPSSPLFLGTKVEDGRVELKWNASLTNDPSNSSVSYNVRVGSGPGQSDVVSSMSHTETGRLLVPKPGNAASATSFNLKNLPDGQYFWSVQTVNNALVASGFSSEGSFSVTGSLATDVDDEVLLPSSFELKGTYPNPFSQNTHVSFDLPEPTPVEMNVYSVLGQHVTRISGGLLGAGSHRLEWTGTDSRGNRVGSGVYFFELRAGARSLTGSMTLVH